MQITRRQKYLFYLQTYSNHLKQWLEYMHAQQLLVERMNEWKPLMTVNFINRPKTLCFLSSPWAENEKRNIWSPSPKYSFPIIVYYFFLFWAEIPTGPADLTLPFSSPLFSCFSSVYASFPLLQEQTFLLTNYHSLISGMCYVHLYSSIPYHPLS